MSQNRSNDDRAAGIPRRQFLKQSALAAAGLAAGYRSSGPENGLWYRPRTDSAAAAKSKVVWIHHAKVIDAAGRVEAPPPGNAGQSPDDIHRQRFARRRLAAIRQARGHRRPQAQHPGADVDPGLDHTQHFPAMVGRWRSEREARPSSSIILVLNRCPPRVGRPGRQKKPSYCLWPFFSRQSIDHRDGRISGFHERQRLSQQPVCLERQWIRRGPASSR